MISFSYGAARKGERVAPGTGFRQSIGADSLLCQTGEILSFLTIVCPAHDCVIHKRILDVNEHAKRCIDSRYFLNSQNRHKETTGAPAKFLRNMNSHKSKIKQLRNNALLEFCLFVHFSDERPDTALGKRPAGITKQLLIFR